MESELTAPIKPSQGCGLNVEPTVNNLAIYCAALPTLLIPPHLLSLPAMLRTAALRRIRTPRAAYKQPFLVLQRPVQSQRRSYAIAAEDTDKGVVWDEVYPIRRDC